MGRLDDYPDLLDVHQAAAILAVHHRTIRRMIHRGDLPAFRLVGGQELRIKKADLLAQALVPVVPADVDDDDGDD